MVKEDMSSNDFVVSIIFWEQIYSFSKTVASLVDPGRFETSETGSHCPPTPSRWPQTPHTRPNGRANHSRNNLKWDGMSAEWDGMRGE